jgi:hypothetical protein
MQPLSCGSCVCDVSVLSAMCCAADDFVEVYSRKADPAWSPDFDMHKAGITRCATSQVRTAAIELSCCQAAGLWQ